MYELYQLNQNLYQIHSSEPYHNAMEGTMLAIGTYMVSQLGFKPVELEAALLDMLEQDRDAAHFGIMKTFIYSFNKDDKYGKVS